ncbi:MAG: helix-turn-helix domain-containing protein [Clostridia bacterium]|nr:helix-turn-helix domain-containing protein [Clostridia bacterium]
MNLNIGQKIKELRLKKGITQEALAEKMGVSCPAVSKWERGETYPDITMLIPLASYFGVSTDNLLGVRDPEDRNVPKEFFNHFHSISDSGERYEFLKKVHRDYPNDWMIHELLCQVTDDLEEKRKLAFELLEKCPDRYKRDEVIHELIISEDDEERLKQLIEKYTTETDISRTRLLCYRYLKKKEYSKYEPLKQLLLYIDLTQNIFPRIRPDYPSEVNVNKALWAAEITLRIINMLTGMEGKSLVAGDGEPDLWYERRWVIGMQYCARLSGSGKTEEALNALEELTDLIEKFLTLPEGTALDFRCPAFSSLKGIPKREPDEESGTFISTQIVPKNEMQLERYYLMLDTHFGILPLTAEHGWEWFDPIRNTDRFKACVARLKKYDKIKNDD